MTITVAEICEITREVYSRAALPGNGDPIPTHWSGKVTPTDRLTKTSTVTAGRDRQTLDEDECCGCEGCGFDCGCLCS